MATATGQLRAVQALSGRKFHISPEVEPEYYNEGDRYPKAQGLPALCGARSGQSQDWWSVTGELAMFEDADLAHLLCKRCVKGMTDA